MTDDEIRSLVRVAIEKHLGAPGSAQGAPSAALPWPPAPVGGGSSAFALRASADRSDLPGPATPTGAISFSRYVLPRAEDDTMCLIEPAVPCNHCGYCQCHGH